MAVSAPALKHEGRQQQAEAGEHEQLVDEPVGGPDGPRVGEEQGELVTMIAISATDTYRARARRHMAESAAAPRQARGERSTKSPNRCMCL